MNKLRDIKAQNKKVKKELRSPTNRPLTSEVFIFPL